MALVAGAFGLSRIIIELVGVRFQISPLLNVQLLDMKVLQADPFQAFTHNFIQPPLWNFFVGAVLRWSPFAPRPSFLVLFMLADLVTVLCLWYLLVGLGARRWIASVAVTLVGSSPTLIADEHTLHYEALLTMVVTLSAFTCLRYLREPTTARLVQFSSVLVVGVLTRTTLHPFWLAGGLALALIVSWPVLRRRTMLAVVAGTVLLVGAPLVHRAVAFDTAGFSSYWPMNLGRITYLTFPHSELQRLADEGKISDAALVPPFASYSAYADLFPPCHPDTGVPAYDDFTKDYGEINLNNICFLPVYQRLRSDALTTIRANPDRYLAAVARSTLIYSNISRTSTKRGSPLDRWFSIYQPVYLPVHVHYGWGSGVGPEVGRLYSAGFGRDPLSVTVLLSYVVCLGYGVRGARRWFGRRLDAVAATRLFIAFTFVMVTVPSVMFDTFENARFRQPLEPILLGPVYVLVLEFGRRGFLGLRRRVAGPPSSDQDREVAPV